jgi:hypothetical protein
LNPRRYSPLLVYSPITLRTYKVYYEVQEINATLNKNKLRRDDGKSK